MSVYVRAEAGETGECARESGGWRDRRVSVYVREEVG